MYVEEEGDRQQGEYLNPCHSPLDCRLFKEKICDFPPYPLQSLARRANSSKWEPSREKSVSTVRGLFSLVSGWSAAYHSGAVSSDRQGWPSALAEAEGV